MPKSPVALAKAPPVSADKGPRVPNPAPSAKTKAQTFSVKKKGPAKARKGALAKALSLPAILKPKA